MAAPDGSTWQENQKRIIYPFFWWQHILVISLVVVVILLIVAIIAYVWTLTGKDRTWVGRLIGTLISLIHLFVSVYVGFSLFSSLMFTPGFQHVDTVTLNDVRYNLVSAPIFQLRCDPYCFPEFIHLFACDSLGLICTLVESPSEEEYIARGIFNWRAPYRTETIELRVEGDTLLGLINGEEALRYSPNER